MERTDMAAKRILPGDRSLSHEQERMIRVNQAGEFGAIQIYKGQLAVLKGKECEPVIQHMLEQEHEHLDKFNKLMIERRIRPTLLAPLWNVAGYAVGAATAALGEKAAMACTVAVEEVIDQHYAEQEKELGDTDKNLKSLISKCREEENEHKEIGLSYGPTPYPILSMFIKTAAKSAIWLSKRV